MSRIATPNVHQEMDRADRIKATVASLSKTLGSDRDWPEDFALENGNYQNKCLTCGEMFMGYKRRARCKACATDAKAKAPSFSKTAQERRESLLDNGWKPVDVAFVCLSQSGTEIAVVLHDGTYFRGCKNLVRII